MMTCQNKFKILAWSFFGLFLISAISFTGNYSFYQWCKTQEPIPVTAHTLVQGREISFYHEDPKLRKSIKVHIPFYYVVHRNNKTQNYTSAFDHFWSDYPSALAEYNYYNQSRALQIYYLRDYPHITADSKFDDPCSRLIPVVVVINFFYLIFPLLIIAGCLSGLEYISFSKKIQHTQIPSLTP